MWSYDFLDNNIKAFSTILISMEKSISSDFPMGVILYLLLHLVFFKTSESLLITRKKKNVVQFVVSESRMGPVLVKYLKQASDR